MYVRQTWVRGKSIIKWRWRVLISSGSSWIGKLSWEYLKSFLPPLEKFFTPYVCEKKNQNETKDIVRNVEWKRFETLKGSLDFLKKLTYHRFFENGFHDWCNFCGSSPTINWTAYLTAEVTFHNLIAEVTGSIYLIDLCNE